MAAGQQQHRGVSRVSGGPAAAGSWADHGERLCGLEQQAGLAWPLLPASGQPDPCERWSLASLVNVYRWTSRMGSLVPFLTKIWNRMTTSILKQHASNLPNTEQAVKTKPKQDTSFSFIFHRFWPFICCLSVSFCGLIKGISPNICILCVRVQINKHSFEPFLCLDLVFRTLAVILFQICFFLPQLSSYNSNSVVGMDWWTGLA